MVANFEIQSCAGRCREETIFGGYGEGKPEWSRVYLRWESWFLEVKPKKNEGKNSDEYCGGHKFHNLQPRPK